MKTLLRNKTAKQGAAGIAAPFAVIAAFSLLNGASAVYAQGPQPTPAAMPPPFPYARSTQFTPPGQPNPELLLHRMVQASQVYPFIAREITLNVNGQETEQWVRWDPRQGLRRESIRPEAGDILIDNFKSSWVFSQRERKWSVQNSLLPKPNGRIRDIFQNIKKGDLRARWIGQDMVAGRVADIVLVSPSAIAPAPTRRMWIDRATGVRLKMEDIGAAGRTLSTSYYLSIDLAPQIDAHDFEPPALPVNGPLVQNIKHQLFKSVEEAAKAGFVVHQPSTLPPGFVLREIDVTGKNSDRIAQRYGNGISVISLIHSPSPLFGKKVLEQLGPSASGFITGPRGARSYLWHDNAANMNYAILSNLPDEQIKRIADSVR